jgi:hypothetical protein
MKHKHLICGIAVALAALAENPNFIPDSTFKGSSLAGWHVLGQADWSAQNGELIGKGKDAGGWLMLDRSYQDVGFFASFHCAGGCNTGVLLRAEKTPEGTKGVYVSLAGENLSLAKVTLNAGGKQLTSERLRPATEMVRYAPAPGTAAGQDCTATIGIRCKLFLMPIFCGLR